MPQLAVKLPFERCDTIGPMASELRGRAFEAEAMPHAASLLRAACSITRDASLAEDLVQDTLLRAWRYFDRFERGTNCKAWLFRIMLNLWPRLGKKRTAQRLASAEIDEIRAADPAAAGSDFLEHSLVRRAFEALPDDQRVVLHLAIVDGFTSREISEMLSLPIGTVMSRVSRGRAALRDRLAGAGILRGRSE
jgi:RNA polymerase sigma-70 factor (ECF subfamily)